MIGKPTRDALLVLSVISLFGGGWLIRLRLNRGHRQVERLLLSLRDGDHALCAVATRQVWRRAGG